MWWLFYCSCLVSNDPSAIAVEGIETLPLQSPSLQVQAVQVPSRRLTEQIERFLPPKTVTFTMPLDDFKKKLAGFQSRHSQKPWREPRSASLNASIDLDTGILVGTGTWQFSESSPSEEGSPMSLFPWRITAESVTLREGTSALGWGTTTDGRLVILGAPTSSTSVSVAWNARGRRSNDSLEYDLQFPAARITFVDLEVPQGWTARSHTTMNAPLNERTVRLFADSQGRLRFSIDVNAGSSSNAKFVEEATIVCDLDEKSTRFRLELNAEILDPKASELSLMVDPQLEGIRPVSDQPGDWQSQVAPDGRLRWSFKPATVFGNRFRAVMQGELPAALGRKWHPPVASVESAYSRQENIRFRIHSPVEIIGIDDGRYNIQSAAEQPEGVYEIAYRGRPLRSESDTPLLSIEDVVDWRELLELLRSKELGEKRSPIRRVRELLDPTTQSIVKDAENAETLAEPQQRQLLIGLNTLLRRSDLLDEIDFPSAISPAELDDIFPGPAESLDPARLVVANRRLLDIALGESISLYKLAGGRPGLMLVERRSRLDTTAAFSIDLVREPIELNAEFRMQVRTGQTSQLRLLLSKGWRFSTAESSPADVIASVRSQVNESQTTTVWITFVKPLEPGESFRLMLKALQEGLSTGMNPSNLKLPEFRLLDSVASEPFEYQILLNPLYRCDYTQLPPSVSAPIELNKTAEPGRYVFRFAPPLREVNLPLVPTSARFQVQGTHRIRRRTNDWHHAAELNVDVTQGSLSTLYIVTRVPLPKSLKWTITGAQTNVERFELSPMLDSEFLIQGIPDVERAPDDLEEPMVTAFRYILETETPIKGKVRLESEWTSSDDDVSVPLIQLPDATDSSNSVLVESRTGRVIDVDASGLAPTSPDTVYHEDDISQIVWASRYDRLAPGAMLRLSVRPKGVPLENTTLGQAMIVGRCLVSKDSHVYQLGMDLACGRDVPLVVSIPQNAHVWDVSLDGHSIVPQLVGTQVQVTANLRPGVHRCLIMYSVSQAPVLGVHRALIASPLPDWETLTSQWSVRYPGPCHLILGNSLRSRASLRSLSRDDVRWPIVVLNKDQESLQVVQNLETTFKKAVSEGIVDEKELVRSMLDALPQGWSAVTGRRFLASIGSLQDGRFGLREWLIHRRILLVFDHRVVLFTKRLPAQVSRIGHWDLERWLNNLGEQSNRQGIDESGEFLSAGALYASDQPRFSSSLDPGNIDESIYTWLVTEYDANNRQPSTVLVIPVELASRWSRVLALSFMALLIILGRKWTFETHRKVLAVLFVGEIILGVVGGLPADLLSLPLWCGTGTLTLILVSRSLRSQIARATPPNAVTFLLLAMATTTMADDPSVHRVLIPVDDAGKASDVVIPEPLHRLLNQPAPEIKSSFHLQSAKYSGRWNRQKRIIEWEGRLTGTWNRQPRTDRSVELGFLGVDVIGVRANGKQADFLPPSVNAPLNIRLPENVNAQAPDTAESWEFDIRFHVPTLERPGQSGMSFQPPRAAKSVCELQIDSQSIKLDPESLLAGWEMSAPNNDGMILRIESNREDQISLIWRESLSEALAPTISPAEALHLLDFTANDARWRSAIQIQFLQFGTGVLVFEIPRFVQVRRVEGPTLIDWKELPTPPSSRSRQLEMTFRPENEDAATVFLEGDLIPREQPVMKLPTGIILNQPSPRQVWGVRVPPGWTVENASARFTENVDVSTFSFLWSRMRTEVVPDQLSLVLRSLEATPDAMPSIRVNPSEPVVQARQQATVVVDPVARSTRLNFQVTAKIQQAPLSKWAFNLPPDFRVLDVKGNDLSKWFVQDRRVVLLFQKPVEQSTTVSVTGLGIIKEPLLANRNDLTVRCNPLLWERASTIHTDWIIQSPAEWNLLAGGKPIALDGVSSPSPMFTTIGEEPAVFDMEQRDPRIDCQARTKVTVGTSEVTLEGKFEVEVQEGSVEQLRFKTPAGLSNIQWELRGFTQLPSTAEREFRFWTFQAPGPITGKVTARWTTSTISDQGQLTVPRIELDPAKQSRHWVQIINRTNRGLAIESTGLISEPVPASLADSDAELIPTESQRSLLAFRVDDPAWKLSLAVEEQRSAVEPFRLLHAHVSLLETRDGSVLGESRWQILDSREGVMEIVHPETISIDRIEVDDVPAPLADREPGKLSIPIYRKGHRQDVTIHWSTPSLKVGEVMKLPRLDSSTPARTLLKFAGQKETSIQWTPTEIPRLQWLYRRFTLEVEEIRDRVNRLSGIEAGRLLARCVLDSRRIETELVLAMKSIPTSETQNDEFVSLTKGYAALVKDRDDHLSHVPQEKLREWESDAQQSDRLPTLPEYTVEHAQFFLSENTPESMKIARRIRWPSRDITSNDLVRIAAASLSLVIVSFASLWNSMRLFWPGPMLTVGLAWSNFADSYFVGWIMMIAAVMGTISSIRRWFRSDPWTPMT